MKKDFISGWRLLISVLALRFSNLQPEKSKVSAPGSRQRAEQMRMWPSASCSTVPHCQSSSAFLIVLRTGSVESLLCQTAYQPLSMGSFSYSWGRELQRLPKVMQLVSGRTGLEPDSALDF